MIFVWALLGQDQLLYWLLKLLLVWKPKIMREQMLQIIWFACCLGLWHALTFLMHWTTLKLLVPFGILRWISWIFMMFVRDSDPQFGATIHVTSRRGQGFPRWRLSRDGQNWRRNISVILAVWTAVFFDGLRCGSLMFLDVPCLMLARLV